MDNGDAHISYCFRDARSCSVALTSDPFVLLSGTSSVQLGPGAALARNKWRARAELPSGRPCGPVHKHLFIDARPTNGCLWQ